MSAKEPQLRNPMKRSPRSPNSKRIDIVSPGIPGGEIQGGDEALPGSRRAFSILAFTMNRFIVDHVVRSARLFDNDAEAMILFGMLAHLNVGHLMPPGSSPRATLGSDGRIPDLQLKLRPVRSSDLAQITGRPRETIRRKLERMRKQGRVQRVRGGWVYEASSIDADMQALALGSVSRFLATADILRSAARTADDAGPVNVGHRGTR